MVARTAGWVAVARSVGPRPSAEGRSGRGSAHGVGWLAARFGGFAGREQAGEAVDQQPLQHRSPTQAEVAERLVVDAAAAARPSKGHVHAARPPQRPGAGEPFDRRVQPRRRQQPSIRRWMARTSRHRLDPGVEFRDVQTLGEGPDLSRPVLRRYRLVRAHRAKLDLATLGPRHPARHRPRRARRRRPLRQLLEKSALVSLRHGPPTGIIAMPILANPRHHDRRTFAHKPPQRQTFHRLRGPGRAGARRRPGGGRRRGATGPGTARRRRSSSGRGQAAGGRNRGVGAGENDPAGDHAATRGRAVPIRQSRVTSAARSSSRQLSVPAGRSGRTR